MLFSITADYTPQAIANLRDNPTINRREIVEHTLEAAGGGKVVAFYGRIANGPGALAIIDTDPTTAMALCGIVAASGGVQNVRIERLLAQEEIVTIRQKAGNLSKTYRSAAE
jgi:uncharacterized protein with GYD domain